SMMGGSHYGITDPSVAVENVASPGPWRDQSGSDLARDAGINDIGSSADRGDDSSRSGFFDSASSDSASNDDDDRDDMDLDSDNSGGDGDSDFA
ncbi:MAG: DUF2076 domain-containing protein, partial [Bradyrhizobium sp.]